MTMTWTRAWCAVAALAALDARAEPSVPAGAEGPFRADLESLRQYRCPDWFRDAKFGIWSHWGPQAVPERGDWYAKKMYQEGSPVYKDHLERWGHPSKHGYKDIIPLWTAERWDPDRLMGLYKRAGARYFVSMGSHHDNYFLWDSKLHRWTSTRVGPRRDVVGDWQRAAKKHGLRFGVSEHLGASFTWFQVSRGADKSGPLAGVPYDGADPAFEDLYHWAAGPGDTKWYSTDPRWHRRWYDCIRELVDVYQPDLLYTDGALPFGEGQTAAGLALVAHYFNASAARAGGAPDVVYTCKQRSEGRWVEDLERGVMPEINPHPWQTDTSIGDWYYNRDWKYRPVSWTIHMLVDIVSKNGNLLLNVVQRPDGSLDPEVEQQLEELAAWIAVHGEAIYGTRPWGVFGEGRVRTRGGHFKEDFKYTAEDIRFTTRGDDLYAVALGWPESGRLRIRSLAAAAGRVESVSLIGGAGAPRWRQTEEAMEVDVPGPAVSPHTCALKIRGRGLRPVPLPREPVTIEPDGKGHLVLQANDAELEGERIKIETQHMRPNIGFWDAANEWAWWQVKTPEGGVWRVAIEAATIHSNAGLAIAIADQHLSVDIPAGGDWDAYRAIGAGVIRLPTGGVYRLTIRARDPAAWRAVNVRGVRLTPAQ